MYWVGLSKPIRDPTHPEDPIKTNPKSANPIIPTVDGGSSPPETDFGRSISVSIPQNQKNPNWPVKNPDSSEKPRFRRETQIPARKIPKSGGEKKKKKPRSRPKNPNSGDNSRRSGKILTEFGEISLIPMRFSLNLEFSHYFLEFSRRFLKIQTSTNPFATCWSLIRPTRLLRRSTTGEIFQNPIPSGRFRVNQTSGTLQPLVHPL